MSKGEYLRKKVSEFITSREEEGYNLIQIFNAFHNEIDRIIKEKNPDIPEMMRQAREAREAEEAERAAQAATDTVPPKAKEEVQEIDAPLPELDEETYYRLADECIRARKGRRCPNERILKTSLKILYVIHKKEYEDVDDFCKKVSEMYNIALISATAHTVGNSIGALYSGLMSFIDRYLKDCTYERWTFYSKKKRLERLEAGEASLYREMAKKFMEEKGEA